MYDFQAELESAKRSEKNGDYFMAAYSYWSIGFAYEEEEMPLAYSPQIGDEANARFYKVVNKHRDEILRER